MEKLGSSILVLCLNERAGSNLSKSLADNLGLHFASAKDIVAYELFDANEMLEKCGKAYFKKREKSSLKGLAGYDDTIIFLSYDLFVNNQTIFKTLHPKLYFKLPKRKLDKKTDPISLIAFEERDKLLQEKADLVIEVSGDGKSAINKILKELKTKL